MLYSKCICKHGFLLNTQVHAKQTRHVTEAHRRAEHLLVERMSRRARCEHSFKKFVWVTAPDHAMEVAPTFLP